MTAALLRHMIDRASCSDSPTATDLLLRQIGMNNCSLCCFNNLSQDGEISGVQVSSAFLQLPSYYVLYSNFTRIELRWLRQHGRTVIQPELMR